MQKIKETLSICPLCLKKIRANVVENKSVFLIKKCKKHGKFVYLLEKDTELYHKLMNKNFLEQRLKFINLIIPVTFRCNLNCSICYSAKATKKDLSIEQIKKVVSNYRGCSVILSGGEPTMREDLPEIVKIIIEYGNIPILATNGIKLADYNYALELKKSGLKYIMFSLDALDEKIYKKIGKEPLLEARLKALENIRKMKMKVIISMMRVKNVNECEIKKIFNFCVKNCNFIKELRIRSMVPIGRYLKKEKCYLSELMKDVCASIGIDRQALLNEFDFWKIFENTFRNREYVHRPCSFTFHLKIQNGNFFSPFTQFSANKLRNSRFKRLILLFWLIKIFGFSTLVRYVFNNFNGLKTLFDSKKIFKISLRSWPTKYDIDLQEIERCQTGYLLDDQRVEPFCYANSTCG